MRGGSGLGLSHGVPTDLCPMRGHGRSGPSPTRTFSGSAGLQSVHPGSQAERCDLSGIVVNALDEFLADHWIRTRD